MITRVVVFAAAVFLATASTSVAQPKEKIGRFVADARITSTGLPIVEGWTPVVPVRTEVPSRALGIEAGGNIYVATKWPVAVGFGATWMSARTTTTPPQPAETVTTPPPVNTIPDVSTRVTALTPQLSLNFGHALGWSYISAGLGRARVNSQALLAGGATTFTPRASGWVQAMNFGGGARWLITDHVGVGFDLRWQRLGEVEAGPTHPGAPRTMVFVAGAGLVLK
ncbi:MAG: hypothetical protein H0T71_00635 [Acidobacteria bacterium]|nr:hypothetical protein [Acidobacteriota bacterium]